MKQNLYCNTKLMYVHVHVVLCTCIGQRDHKATKYIECTEVKPPTCMHIVYIHVYIHVHVTQPLTRGLYIYLSIKNTRIEKCYIVYAISHERTVLLIPDSRQAVLCCVICLS